MRTGGYAPIGDYAAIGDGRTVALVARDGAIDWLCLPNMDSPSVFGALLDAERGGRFALAPDDPFEEERRYVEDTNVLETTFRTAKGVVRVTDAMTIPAAGLHPLREVVRAVEGLAGSVSMRWRAEPRFDYGLKAPRLGLRNGVGVADCGAHAVAVRTWEAGESAIADGALHGRFEARGGRRALLVLSASHQEPLVFPSREEVERRLERTLDFWRGWARSRRYEGPWRDAVVRSALALKLLVFAPSGAIAAAPTTSLPETIGGERNWDYRFAWIRDAAFTLEALLDIGCHSEARAFFSWLLQASQRTHPRLQVLYRLDGGARAPEKDLQLAGYRGSTPVRIGNAAVDQRQLDIYGDLFETAWIYTERDRGIDGETGRRLAKTADLVCEIWRQPDQGLWEVRSEPRHFTQSKMMCWVALDRACRLARAGILPDDRVERWEKEAAQIRAFVETSCWSEEKRTYLRSPGEDGVDASLLLGCVRGYSDGRDTRMQGTIDAIRAELGHGPFVDRYREEDGLQGKEGAFLACSFWLVEALTRAGRGEEAGELMEALLPYANDVGLFAEEADVETGAALGNFPQGLTHLALVSAAVAHAGGHGR